MSEGPDPDRRRGRAPAAEDEDSEWLVEGAEPGPEQRPDTGSETNEWLAVGPTTVELTEAHERPQPEAEPELVAESPPPPAGPRRSGPPGGGPGRRPPPRLVARVAKLERQLSRMETELGGQVQELRAELERLRRDRDADQELIGVLTERFRARPRPAAGEPLDLNAASFEQLRELGISVTQATRVIAAREASGGFGSLDELDALPGFSPAQLEALKAATQT